MSLIPRFAHASTRAVAEECLKKGIIRHPSVCLVKEGNYLLFVTRDNKLDMISGYNQITDIKSLDGILYFMAGDNVIYTADAAVTPDTLQRIKDDVEEAINLSSYAKSEDVTNLLDSKIGDIGGARSVRDYVDSLSYNSLSEPPISNLYGSLTKTVVISGLEDGVYKVSGQFKIGGSHQTIQISGNDVIFVVAHNHIDHTIAITQLTGNVIRIYTLSSDGSYTSDRYITESYVREQDFITSKEVRDYVKTLVTDAIVETIDAVLDERLDAALDHRLGNIGEEAIASLF